MIESIPPNGDETPEPELPPEEPPRPPDDEGLDEDDAGHGPAVETPDA